MGPYAPADARAQLAHPSGCRQGDVNGWLLAVIVAAALVLVAVASLLVSAGYGVFAEHMGMHPYARPTQLTIGVSFLGESLLVRYRARRTGTPFAPEREPPLALLGRRSR
ncbi:hypothetical protein GKJPGBOP_03611 [Streptomyces paromomycinus]|uniref:Uncharacterized protein n=1 Tax=Streptomyces paromomycinus TaxID=92743 RepID=A0A401W3R7_STREY|nr:hypothetical protein GKJPGBOP_03611 [Streptomyces paromomycinus]